MERFCDGNGDRRQERTACARLVSLVSRLTVAALTLGVCLAAPAQAEKRVALVIGNSAYKSVTPLGNPKNDARLMAATLHALGFALVGGGAQLDLDKSAMDRAVQRFGDMLQGADVGLFYYAGHGLQVRGENYLVPVDANPTRESDVDFQLLDANLVLRQMADAGTKLNLIMLDACRNNPFSGRGLRSVQGGLAQMQAPEGTLISFATQPDSVARDGTGDDSPYTTALVQNIKRPGLGVFDVFNEVGLAVMQATGNAQQPWLSASPIRGSFFFAGNTPPAASTASAASTTAAAPTVPAATTTTTAATSPAAAPTAPAATTTVAALSPAAEARLTTPPDTSGTDFATDCDRLAAHPADEQRPEGVPGVFLSAAIDIVPALRACNEAMRQYPNVARFVFQAGRVAYSQRDYATARQLFEKAMGMGSKIATTDLGITYMNGQGVAKDYARARQLFEEATAKGDRLAAHALGLLYQNGWGVGQDYVAARQWFEKGAAAGEPTAMNALGTLYGRGWGVAKDYEAARQWFEKAAVRGDPPAMRSLGYIYQSGLGVSKDYTLARQWYEKAAAAGEPEAMNGLGWLYQHGFGVAADYVVARQWYEKAAAAGDAAAQNNLGALYGNGFGVAKDYTQALQWYEKAAAAGNLNALNNLGWFYQNGFGTAKDYAQALQWYEKAAAGGHALAMNHIGWLYQHGLGVAKDYEEALRWYQKGAAAGNASAMNNVGVFYQNGYGVAKDPAQARQWYEKAAAAGDETAKKNLQNLQKSNRRRR